PAGVAELALGPDLHAGRIALDAMQAHERRTADEIDDRLHAAAAAPRHGLGHGDRRSRRIASQRRVAHARPCPPAIAGTMLTSSPSFTGVSRLSRKRMSSSATNTLTKRRTAPVSSQMRSLIPGYAVSRLE